MNSLENASKTVKNEFFAFPTVGKVSGKQRTFFLQFLKRFGDCSIRISHKNTTKSPLFAEYGTKIVFVERFRELGRFFRVQKRVPCEILDRYRYIFFRSKKYFFFGRNFEIEFTVVARYQGYGLVVEQTDL